MVGFGDKAVVAVKIRMVYAVAVRGKGEPGTVEVAQAEGRDLGSKDGPDNIPVLSFCKYDISMCSVNRWKARGEGGGFGLSGSLVSVIYLWRG